MKIRLYILLFLFGWVHNQADGSCSTGNMDKNTVIQFCSGSNITGKIIVLSTENASSLMTNCTCYFTVANSTMVNITGNCTNKIYHGFLGVTGSKCGDVFQYVQTTRILQFGYINNETNADSYCKHIEANDGELKGTCFNESYIPTTETSSTLTTVGTESSSKTEQNSTNGYEGTTAAITTTKGTTAAVTSTKDTTAEVTSTKDTTAEVTTTKGTALVSTSKTTYKSTTFDSTMDKSTTVTFSNKYQDNLQLVIIIIVSVVALISTLVIIKIAFCLRNRRLKKQEQSRPPNFSANPSFDETEDYSDEMVYNELYHSRIINRGQMNPECDGVGDKEEITPHRQTHYNIATSAMSKANDSGFQSQNGNSSVNSASMKNENPLLNQTDDSGDEMVYNELYHNRNVNRGHMVSAYCDYEDVTHQRHINPNKRQMSDFQSKNDNSSVYAISAKHKKSNEVIVNSEPVYALPDKKKKHKSDGDAVYSLPERKNKKKRQETKLESSEFGIKNDKENNILW